MNKQQLNNYTIVLTRPKDSIFEVAKTLKNLGATVLEFPSIETQGIFALDESDTKKRLIKNFQREVGQLIDETEPVCIAFTSPRGVPYFFEQLDNIGITKNAILEKNNLSFAVIGSGTEKALYAYGMKPDFMPEVYAVAHLGQLLVKQWNGGKIYLFRAQNGAKEINHTLAQAHLPYVDVTTYITSYANNAHASIAQIQHACTKHPACFVFFTSRSTVEGFVKQVKLPAYNHFTALCIGEQTAQKAQEYGMSCIISKQATMDSMIQKMLEYVANCRTKDVENLI